MPASTLLTQVGLTYRVHHPEFNPALAYSPLAHLDYGETSWAYLLFITERGMTYSVRVDRCTCLNAHDFSRPLEGREQDVCKPIPRSYNPDLNTDF